MAKTPTPKVHPLVRLIERKLYDMLLSGGGDAETIRLSAQDIAYSVTRSIKKSVENFESAVRNEEMAGAAHPDDREAIHQKYLEAKRKLVE